MEYVKKYWWLVVVAVVAYVVYEMYVEQSNAPSAQPPISKPTQNVGANAAVQAMLQSNNVDVSQHLGVVFDARGRKLRSEV